MKFDLVKTKKMELDKTKLQEVVEKIAYQQTAEDQADDLFNKMGMLNEYVQEQLALANVINWVAVSHTNPPEGEHKTYFVRDDMGFMYERNWKGHFWEGDHIVNETKVTHWTIVKPPCL